MNSKATKPKGNNDGGRRLSDYLEAVRSVEGPSVERIHSILTNRVFSSPPSLPISSSITSIARSPMFTIGSIIAVPLSVVAAGIGAFLLLQSQEKVAPIPEREAKVEMRVQSGEAHINEGDRVEGEIALPSQMIVSEDINGEAKGTGNNHLAVTKFGRIGDEDQVPLFEARDNPDYSSYTIYNLESLNSSDIEYAPSVTADGGTLYFISNKPGGVGGHDVWYATKSNPRSIEFSSPINLGAPINTDKDEGVLAISADANTIYFTACNRSDGIGDCDIYEAHFEGGKWTNIHNVQEINSPYWDSQPSISGSGDTLFFISNRPGALGGADDADIYMAIKKGDGSWNAPVNLGGPINTVKREDSPFILPGSNLLYFSSMGHPGFGGLDFFVSELQEGNVWSTPQNLGGTFNTAENERFITGSPDKNAFYFASERTIPSNKGTLDLFMALRPTSGVNRDGKEHSALGISIHIAPNPATTFIRLDVAENSADKENIVIYDARGKEVYRKSTGRTSDPIAVSDLPNGMYIVRIGTMFGSFVVRK